MLSADGYRFEDHRKGRTGSGRQGQERPMLGVEIVLLLLTDIALVDVRAAITKTEDALMRARIDILVVQLERANIAFQAGRSHEQVEVVLIRLPIWVIPRYLFQCL